MTDLSAVSGTKIYRSGFKTIVLIFLLLLLAWLAFSNRDASWVQRKTHGYIALMSSMLLMLLASGAGVIQLSRLRTPQIVVGDTAVYVRELFGTLEVPWHIIVDVRRLKVRNLSYVLLEINTRDMKLLPRNPLDRVSYRLDGIFGIPQGVTIAATGLKISIDDLENVLLRNWNNSKVK